MEPRRQHRLTVVDYWQLPDDGRRHEILGGELEVTPSPTFEHQRISMSLANVLWNHLKKTNAGVVLAAPMDVILAPDTICQPDLLFVSQDRIPDIVRDQIWGAPDLVIEILSPSTSRLDRITKAGTYAKHGVKEYWIVDPSAQQVHRHTLRDGAFGDPEIFGRGHAIATPLIPGLAVPVDELF